ncbi:DUF4218 domain-containing protein [Plasmodiophora brassicae]
MLEALRFNEYPLAVTSGIDGADVLRWGSESVTPLIQILLSLPPEVRCNLGLIHAVGLIPHIARGHRAAFLRLDTFELNLMFQLGFPVFDATTGTATARAVLSCATLDYKEFSLTTRCSQGGKLDACNRCHVQGYHFAASHATVFPGLWRWSSEDVREAMSRSFFTSMTELGRSKFPESPDDRDRDRTRRQECQFLKDAQPKLDSEMRLRMTSGDTGGHRVPGHDIYSVGLLSGFGHASQYVHDPMHAFCMRVIPRLVKCFDWHGNGKELLSPEIDRAFGRVAPDVPVLTIPNNRRFPATTLASSAARQIGSAIESLEWPTGNCDRPKNPYQSSMKSHDWLIWASDVGIAIFAGLIGTALFNSSDSALSWGTVFAFMHSSMMILSKSFDRSSFDTVAQTFLDACARLETVIPGKLLTISMHSMIHLPEVIRQWGPLSGFVWTYPMERWIKRMKSILTATQGFTMNIAGNVQLISAAAYTSRYWFWIPVMTACLACAICLGSLARDATGVGVRGALCRSRVRAETR